MRDRPKPGEKWVHCKGNVYEILCIAIHSEDHEEMVVYRNVVTKDFWVRPMPIFMGKHDNGAQRFVKKE